MADMTPGAARVTGSSSDGLNNNQDPSLNKNDTDGDDAFLQDNPESTQKAASDTAEPEVTRKPKKTDKPQETDLPDDSGDLSENGKGNGDATSDAGGGEKQTKHPDVISPELRAVLIKTTVAAAIVFVIWLL